MVAKQTGKLDAPVSTIPPAFGDVHHFLIFEMGPKWC
jgi:hypothetical protein